MKKLLQLVAAVLLLSLPTQPVLAANTCDRPACSGHQSMDCCEGAGARSMPPGAMPMGMDCGTPAAMGSAARRCTDDGCCAVSARPFPQVSCLRIAALDASHAARPLVRVQRNASTVLPATRPPGRAVASGTARYILFRDLRI